MKPASPLPLALTQCFTRKFTRLSKYSSTWTVRAPRLRVQKTYQQIYRTMLRFDVLKVLLFFGNRARTQSPARPTQVYRIILDKTDYQEVNSIPFLSSTIFFKICFKNILDWCNSIETSKNFLKIFLRWYLLKGHVQTIPPEVLENLFQKDFQKYFRGFN